MLDVKNIDVAYDKVQVLYEMSLRVQAGEILCLLGRNGAGKTTTLKSIIGLVPVQQGAITLDKTVLTDFPPHKVPGQGVAYVPQGRRLFGELNVDQNLEMGLLNTGKSASAVKAHVLSLFPVLKRRLGQRADSLSGGEQQMLAMARAICTEPSLILLDEPTEGLQPSMRDLIRDVILEMRSEGKAVVLVEQQVDAAIKIADRIMFVENGRAAETVAAAACVDNPALIKKYLSV